MYGDRGAQSHRRARPVRGRPRSSSPGWRRGRPRSTTRSSFGSRRLEAARRAGEWGGNITASDGEVLQIFVSDAYPVDQTVPQSVAEFMIQLYHGPELSQAIVYIAPLAEVQRICGPDAGRLLRPGQREHRRPGRPAPGRDDEGDDPRPRARPQPRAQPAQPALGRGRLGHEALGHGDERLRADEGRHGVSRRRGIQLRPEPRRGACGVVPRAELPEADVVDLDGAGAADRRSELRPDPGGARRAQGGRARTVDGADGRELARARRRPPRSWRSTSS